MKKVAKKKSKKVKEEAFVPTAWIMPEPISQLTASFGQEDLNRLVDKINEIILRLNNVV